MDAEKPTLGSQSAADSVDLPTVVEIAVVAWTAVVVSHEVLGHGGGCALLGGTVRAVSNTESYCANVAQAGFRIVNAAGSVANVIAGLLALALAWQFRAVLSTTWRYFLWLFSGASLLEIVSRLAGARRSPTWQPGPRPRPTTYRT